MVRFVPFKGYFEVVRQFWLKENMINLDAKPENISVNLVSTFYLIPDGRNKKIAEKITKKFEYYIKKNGINFDIIHAHFVYPQGYIAVKLGKKFDIPVVITAHGHDIYDMPFRDNEWNKKIKWILEGSTHIITVSEKNKKILTDKLNIREDKIDVIFNGFNTEKFIHIDQKEAREKIQIPIDKKIILNVANLYPVKGHELLIKAMKAIVKKRQDVICFIIGGGSLTEELERLVNKLELNNYVKIVGYKPSNEIPLWMNAADLFVLPSLKEGNPTVMFEAIALGLPFVGTKVGGIPEIITSELYGLLAEPANSDDLAEKILTALEKKWDKKYISDYAKQFSWEHVAQQTVESYKTILDSKGE